ncbi:MAG: transposase family protein [Phycisphaeraceae bacterium]
MASTSLLEVLALLPDPRQASGLRHPLPALLMHATVAMLGGARSLEAIAQFGRDRAWGDRMVREMTVSTA